jgi:hypothetical protein
METLHRVTRTDIVKDADDGMNSPYMNTDILSYNAGRAWLTLASICVCMCFIALSSSFGGMNTQNEGAPKEKANSEDGGEGTAPLDWMKRRSLCWPAF